MYGHACCVGERCLQARRDVEMLCGVQVMMPAYDCSTWNVLFFIVFLTFGLYFLLSLVLAVTYTHFQDKTKEKVIKHLKRRVTGLTMAFNTLAGPKTMFAMTHQSAGSETPPSRNKMADLSAHAKAVAAAAAARTNMLKRGNSRGSFSFSAYVSNFMMLLVGLPGHTCVRGVAGTWLLHQRMTWCQG